MTKADFRESYRLSNFSSCDGINGNGSQFSNNALNFLPVPRNSKAVGVNDNPESWINIMGDFTPIYIKMENGPTGSPREIMDPGSSRSNSPDNSQGGSDGASSSKLLKPDPKICGVCGDKALGNNFNAITCESCKAFFRRNALKTKEFVCPFKDNCKVDPVTRRFCQKCRLKKCFDIGMKKEWIMTDEEKKMKKIKIEQNRMKRQSSDFPCCDSPASKAACLVDPKSPPLDSFDMSNNSPPDATLPHKIPKQPMMPDGSDSLQHQAHFKDSSRSYSTTDNENEPSPVSMSCYTNSLSPTAVKLSGGGPSLLSGTSAMLQLNTVGKSFTHQASADASHTETDLWNDNSASNLEQIEGMPNAYNTQMPLLSSLIRPCNAESPPDVEIIQQENKDDINNVPSSSLTASMGGDPVKNNFPSHCSTDEQPSCYATDGNQFIQDSSESSDEERKSNNYLTEMVSSRLGSRKDDEFDNEQLPLPLNTMDSILSVAIKAEFSSFGVLSRGRESHSQHLAHSTSLNKAEQNKLNELLLASHALATPVDAEGPVKVSDPSLINVINLTDIAIRRLIQMSKKISAFKNMCQEDQVALLKGSCTEMMILRSVVSYDPDRDSWNIPHSNLGYNIKLGVLKEARGNLYEEHQRFVKSFKSEWRTDENIMMLLCVITLFTAERPNVIHKDVVKLEQDSYYYLLKRYLESTLNGCEARSTYLQLIKKIAELHVLNSNHLRVFLEVNPREVEPLLIEIFDLK